MNGLAHVDGFKICMQACVSLGSLPLIVNLLTVVNLKKASALWHLHSRNINKPCMVLTMKHYYSISLQKYQEILKALRSLAKIAWEINNSKGTQYQFRLNVAWETQRNVVVFITCERYFWRIKH